MSGIILNTFWCHLNSKPLRLEERIVYSQAYWNAYKEPKDKHCPQDSSMLEIRNWLHDKTPEGMPRIVHVGRCKKHKHIWAFEHDKGWYKPDAKQLIRIRGN